MFQFNNETSIENCGFNSKTKALVDNCGFSSKIKSQLSIEVLIKIMEKKNYDMVHT